MAILSIIIPVYNVENYIKECLDSIICQNFEDLEVIVIDDGSDDKSGSICDYYMENYPFIKVIHQENAGVSTARNSGLNIATGEYILFLDGDDLLYKDCLDVVPEILADKADIAHCGYVTFKDGTNILDKHEFYFDDEILKRGNGIEFLNYNFKRNGALWGVGRSVIKRSLIEDNNIRFDEKLKAFEDGDIFIRIHLLAKKIVAFDNIMFAYRIERKNSIMSTISYCRIESTLRGYRKWQRFFAENYEYDEVKYILNIMSETAYYMFFSVLKAQSAQKKKMLRLCNEYRDVLKYVHGYKKRAIVAAYRLVGVRLVAAFLKYMI